MEDQRERGGRGVPPASEQSSPGLDRRKFLGALGATAAAALLGPEGAKLSGQSTSPPPVPSQQSPADPFMGPTYVTQGYNQPNILMIMVDQMGTPRWLPGPTLPHIANLQAYFLHLAELLRGVQRLHALPGYPPNGAVLAANLHLQHAGELVRA